MLGQSFADVLAQHVLGEVLAGLIVLADNVEEQVSENLVVFVAAVAEDVGDTRHRAENFFDLAWEDVLAALDHHVVGATTDVQVAVLVDTAEVTDLEQAIDGGELVLLVQVTDEGELLSGVDHANLTRLDFLAVVTQDANLGANCRATCGVRAGCEVRAGCDGAQAGLGGAVEVTDNRTEAVSQRGDEPARDGVTRGDNEAERANLAVRLLIQNILDLAQEEGRGNHAVTAVLFTLVNSLLRVEDTHGDNGGAGSHANQHICPAPGVEHGCGLVNDHVAAPRNTIGDCTHSCRCLRLIAQDTLRDAGGAGGHDDDASLLRLRI